MKTIFKIIKFALLSVASILLIPILFVLLFKVIDPPTSSFILQRQVESLFTENDCDEVLHEWTDYDDISSNMKMAVIAAEDQTFAEHWGFDLKSIEDALEEAEKGRRVRGASTISQQTAKNLFLWSGKSWIRKGAEAYITLLMELLWSKQRILEVYLNTAQFGNCTFGVTSAAKQYFKRTPSKLNAAQASLMAAVLPNPVRFRVNRPSGYTLRRANWIQRQISQLGGKSYLTANGL